MSSGLVLHFGQNQHAALVLSASLEFRLFISDDKSAVELLTCACNVVSTVCSAAALVRRSSGLRLGSFRAFWICSMVSAILR